MTCGRTARRFQLVLTASPTRCTCFACWAVSSNPLEGSIPACPPSGGQETLDKNPALNVRRPNVHDESRTLGLDRNELGSLLVQAGLGDLRDGALITLLALNGLRISEALNADIDDLSTERGHRTLAIVRKGGKHVTIVTIPIAPRTGRALDPYIGERTTRWGRSSSVSKVAAWTATAPIGWSSGW